MGARRSPARPTVMAPATATWHMAPAPSARTSRATAALSIGGSVLGMATTAVNPPSAAARAAALDGLGFLAAGLAQMGVQVDESRGHQAPAGVEHGGPPAARRYRWPDVGDARRR